LGEALASQQLVIILKGGDGDFPEMTVTALDRVLVAGDAGGVSGKRRERPDPEVPEKARRRKACIPA
jgi:hypothetical protein